MEFLFFSSEIMHAVSKISHTTYVTISRIHCVLKCQEAQLKY
jgi:hypothetical protein